VSWSSHYSRSEKLAIEAELAVRACDAPRAETLYREAAEQEAAAFDAIEKGKDRTRGITAVSAVSLWYKGRDYSSAEQFAHRSLATGQLPPFAEVQLRNLLQSVWTAAAAAKAGVRSTAFNRSSFEPWRCCLSVLSGSGGAHQPTYRRCSGLGYFRLPPGATSSRYGCRNPSKAASLKTIGLRWIA